MKVRVNIGLIILIVILIGLILMTFRCKEGFSVYNDSIMSGDMKELRIEKPSFGMDSKQCACCKNMGGKRNSLLGNRCTCNNKCACKNKFLRLFSKR